MFASTILVVAARYSAVITWSTALVRASREKLQEWKGHRKDDEEVSPEQMGGCMLGRERVGQTSAEILTLSTYLPEPLVSVGITVQIAVATVSLVMVAS